MANKKLTDLTELTTPADNDFLYIVDVSDMTESAQGTSKKIRKDKVDSGASKENIANKQNSLAIDGTGTKYPTVDAVNTIDLQKVLDVGADASVVDGDNFSNIEITPTYISVNQGDSFASSRTGFYIDNGVLSIENEIDLNKTSIKIDAPTVISTLNFPAKTVAGTYTLATTDDVESISLNDVLANNSMSDIPIVIKELGDALLYDNNVITFESDEVGVPQVNLFFKDGLSTGGISFKFPFSKPEGTYTLATTDIVAQTITNGVTDKSPSEDAVFDALANVTRNIIRDAVPSITVTGTLTETILKSYPLPANTFSSSTLIKIPSFLISKTGTAGTAIIKIYFNSTNTLSGATQIATYTITGTNTYVSINRTYILTSGTIKGLGFTTGGSLSDVTTAGNGFSSATFDTSTDKYIITSCTLSNLADSVSQFSFNLVN